ncbi:MAG: metal-dependent hydrolase [bacterium]|nr:metal-dependent hydrolase [bacterium]
MDLLTQGLLGAVCAQSAAPADETRRAAGVGFVAGMLADADVLIQSANDPLLNLDYHRHFTHALAFIPVGALIGALIGAGLAYLLFRLFRGSRPASERLDFSRLYRYSLCGYALSGLLDACTSYGTHLLWPFSDARIALNLVSVIDPVFTGALLIACCAALYRRRAVFARVGLLLCVLYLAWAFVQQSRAQSIASDLAQRRGHSIERMVVKPSFANTLLWRSVYITADDRVYVDAVRPGLLQTPERIYVGDVSLRHITPQDLLQPARRSYSQRHADSEYERLAAIASDSALAGDIRRFYKFSDGFTAIHPARPDLLGDLRYSMLPNSALPLWGIELDPDRSDRHAPFRAFRKLSPAGRAEFLHMLAGRAPGAGANSRSHPEADREQAE